jgi:hypothetical protein
VLKISLSSVWQWRRRCTFIASSGEAGRCPVGGRDRTHQAFDEVFLKACYFGVCGGRS